MENRERQGDVAEAENETLLPAENTSLRFKSRLGPLLEGHLLNLPVRVLSLTSQVLQTDRLSRGFGFEKEKLFPDIVVDQKTLDDGVLLLQLAYHLQEGFRVRVLRVAMDLVWKNDHLIHLGPAFWRLGGGETRRDGPTNCGGEW